MKNHYHLFFDIESAVSIDEHGRYQAAERFFPQPGQRDSGRRGQRGNADPLTNPRWMFQQICCATILVAVEHADGNIEPFALETFSAPELDERDVLQGLFDVVAQLPAESVELVSWGGAWHDVPLIVARSLRHGLTLPQAWQWMSWGGQGAQKHIDLMRHLTGGSKMKLGHMSEFAAMSDLPVKMTAAPWEAARFMRENRWDRVIEMCEGDCISLAMLFASWRVLRSNKSTVPVVHERICRKIEELAPGRRYIAALRAKRERLFQQRFNIPRDGDAHGHPNG